MKVLHIVDSIGLGGAQTFLKGLFESDHNNELYLYPLRRKEPQIEIKPSINSHLVTQSSSAKYSLKPVEEILNIIKQEKIDIIHCHLFRSIITGIIVKRKYPAVKLVIHEHGEINYDNLKNVLYRKILQYNEKNIEKIIAVSGSTRNNLISKTRIPENKISLLYNYFQPHESNNLDLAVNEKIGHDPETFKIGYVGRLNPVKGIDTLIEALKILQTQRNREENGCAKLDNKKIKLYILGEGPLEKTLKSMVSINKLEDSVLFMGYVKDAFKYFKMFDCIVMPSHHEACSMVLFEAMSQKVPVIVSNVESLNEFIRHQQTGLLFEKSNAKDLCEKVCFTINNPILVKEYAIQAKSTIKKLTLQAYIQQLNQFYTEIINGK